MSSFLEIYISPFGQGEGRVRDKNRICGVAFVILFNKLGTISLTLFFLTSCEVENFGSFITGWGGFFV